MTLAFGFMVQPRSLEETAELARHADAAGYAFLGVADSPVVYQDSFLHQLEALRASERLHVGPLVSHVVLRHPVVVGNALATLNERFGGRSIGVIGTGNSAARGVGAKPATLARLSEAFDCIRGYWSGHGGAFAGTEIPATGLARRGCPLYVAGDGPKIAALAGAVGDGFFYGGSLQAEILSSRLAAGRPGSGQACWVGPTVSFGETVEAVLAEIGAQLAAIANRALRGDLGERGVPAELHEDVRRLWREYDYAFHADSRRARNVELLSPGLAEYLVESFCVWGDLARWRGRLEGLAAAGCDGIVFVLGQDEAPASLRRITVRLRELGYLPDSGTPTL